MQSEWIDTFYSKFYLFYPNFKLPDFPPYSAEKKTLKIFTKGGEGGGDYSRKYTIYTPEFKGKKAKIVIYDKGRVNGGTNYDSPGFRFPSSSYHKDYLCGESATEDNLLYLFPDTPAVPLGCTGELC